MSYIGVKVFLAQPLRNENIVVTVECCEGIGVHAENGPHPAESSCPWAGLQNDV